MKKTSLLIGMITLLFSCSNDDNSGENSTDDNDLVGTWALTDARFVEDPSDPTLNLADEILDALVDEDCFLASFTFNADGTVMSSNSVNYIVPNATPTGLSVDCPTQSDTESGTWILEGNELTLTDENQMSETITIQFEGNNTLIISGEDIDENNYAGADAVFTRQ
ncbi:hypothetical protein GTQ34_12620 [Muricauda sp. JGD-17]|uniref:Lipocalin-like domain-containing protein n=1 Tax=Flagellimonas ochracea TaxID=2696472 RepID=A0A964TFG6_9FLAO|nr:lipocalin family protein [Allomuricauda ochracea]NAY92761.1 hypothetical protein [Allomuricauda ochracea]